jgi:rod shape-determining protein MreC
MVRPDASSRARYLFIAVVVGHVLLISAQVASPSGPSLLRLAFVGVVTEAQQATWALAGGVRTVWGGYVALRGVRAENERLARENTDLRVRLQQERANASAAEQLRGLLDLRPRVPWTTTGAEVVAGSTSPDFRSVTIDKGLSEGVKRDMPVIAAAGVVGRIALPGGHTATVQLIIDRSAAAAARIERSRTEGIALGNGDGTLRFDYLSTTADVQRGDVLVTAGVDGVYPAGLVLGNVERVEKSGSSYRLVTIRPVVDFSTLETVLVLLAPTPVWTPATAARDEKVTR